MRAIRLSDIPAAPNDLRAPCNRITEYHLGPLVTDVDDQDVLYDTCRNCGVVWIIGRVSTAVAAGVRRAARASSHAAARSTEDASSAQAARLSSSPSIGSEVSAASRSLGSIESPSASRGTDHGE